MESGKAGTPAPAAPAQETAPSPEPTTDQTQKRSWTKPVMLTLALVGVIAASIWGVRAWRFGQSHVVTDDAYVTNSVVQIAPQVAGNVAEVRVLDNQRVKKGQVLIRLDSVTYQAAVDQAKAALAVAEANAQGANAGVRLTEQTGTAQIAQASGVVGQAESGIGTAQADVAKSRAGIANAAAGIATAQANVRTAEAGVAAARVGRKRADAAVEGAKAQVETAQAAIKAAYSNVVALQAEVDRTASDLKRYEQLFAQNAIAAQQVDSARAAATAAAAQRDSAKETVSQAQSVLTQRQAEVTAAQEAVRAADAQIVQAQAQVSANRQSVNAASALRGQAQAQLLASQQQVGQAQAKKAQAQGQLSQAQTAPRQLAVSEASKQTAQAKILEARAALEAAEINLKRTAIVAPFDGIVSKKSVQLGQQLAVGQPIMAVVPASGAWVVANLKETQTHGLTPGQKVEIEIDSLPEHKFIGHLDSLSQGTGATFALLPPDNATGNFTKVVQRVPVKILLEPNQPDIQKLRVGLSTQVTIETK